jgi:hypothetical protein
MGEQLVSLSYMGGWRELNNISWKLTSIFLLLMFQTGLMCVVAFSVFEYIAKKESQAVASAPSAPVQKGDQ